MTETFRKDASFSLGVFSFSCELFFFISFFFSFFFFSGRNLTWVMVRSILGYG